MADLTDVYSALQKADAAGDTAGAKQLADYIRSQSAAPAPQGPSLKQTNPGEYDPNSAAYQAKYGATSGNSFLRNAVIGAGKLYTDTGLGAQQLFARAQDALNPQATPRLAALQQQAAEKAQTDAAIAATGGGKVGEIAGALPLALVPGAATLGGSVVSGAALGALRPTTAQDSLVDNTLEGGGAGALGYGVGNAISKVGGAGYEALARQLGLRANSAEEVLANNAAQSAQNMGAAAASPNLANASPEFREAIVGAANKNAGAVNPDALARHVQAESLPTLPGGKRVQLTEGEALQDPVLISNERNARAASPKLAQRFADNNQALGDHLSAIRNEAGPDVFSANSVEHGDTLIDAYKAKDAALNQQIDAAYKEARAAIPDKNASVMDPKALMSDVQSRLGDQLLQDSAPKDVMATLGRLADSGQMTFGNMEALRTNLARISRSGTTDGNTRYAAGLIRDALEQAPLNAGSADAKALLDNARGLARARFSALEEDPAFKAAVYDSVSPDKFVGRFLVNGNRDDVATMARNLGDNETARQTMAVATTDYLKNAAMKSGQNFSQAGYNRALSALSPKLRQLVGPQAAEHLENLGDVARYVEGQPPGSFVNNSNTFTSAMGELAHHGAETVAHSVGLGIPYAIGKRLLGAASTSRAANRALAPGAGLDRLTALRNAALGQ